MVKKTSKAIDLGSLEAAQAAYQTMVPILDRSATKGLISPNKAARHKSRLMIKLRQLH
jgi:small subunit ribosomal protein S20